MDTIANNDDDNKLKQVGSCSTVKGKVSVFVDIQGFLDNKNEIVVKEFAYMLNNSKERRHFVFKPPYKLCELKEHVRNNVRNHSRLHHGILWSEGELDYKHLRQCLNFMIYDNDIEAIYVQGKEQIMWLYQLYLNSAKPLPPIYDVFFMPSLDNAEYKRKSKKIYCEHHDWSANEGSYDFWSIYSHPKHCALQNVLILKDYYCNQLEQFDVFRREKDVYKENEEI